MPLKEKKRVKVSVVEEEKQEQGASSNVGQTAPETPSEASTSQQTETTEIPIEVPTTNEETANEVPSDSMPNATETESDPYTEEVLTQTEEKSKVPFLVLLISFFVGLVIGAGLIGGIFYYRSSINIGTELAEDMPDSTPAATPETTPEAQNVDELEEQSNTEELDLSAFKIQILNGSGIAGEAGRVETLLNTYGFTETTVGNAGTYDFTDTEVSIKESSSNKLIDEFKSALARYSIVESDPLAENSPYDVVITVGKTKK